MRRPILKVSPDRFPKRYKYNRIGVRALWRRPPRQSRSTHAPARSSRGELRLPFFVQRALGRARPGAPDVAGCSEGSPCVEVQQEGGRGDRGSGASARAVRGRARKSTGESTRCRWRSCSARSWSPWAAREFAPERLRERERHRVGAFRFPECRGGRSASQHRDHARWWPPHARVSRSSEIRARTKRHTLDLGGGGQRSVRGRRGRSTSSFAARYGAGGASFPRSPSIN